MDYKARESFLSTHADRLIAGDEHARRFVQQQVYLPPDVTDLLSLARRLKRTLVRVSLSESFRRQLQEDLLAHSGKKMTTESERSLRPLWYSLAAVGSVLPLVGIFVWRRRRRSDTQPLVGAG